MDDDDECNGFTAWCKLQDDKSILDCINDRTAFRYMINLFENACRWNRVVIVKRLLEFPVVQIFTNTGLNLACGHNALAVVNYMLTLPGLDLSRQNWTCMHMALEGINKTIAVRLLQDVRIPKKELVWRWASYRPHWTATGGKDYHSSDMRARDIQVLLTQSRLRMMVMYSKGFGGKSCIPKELVHLISSYTEPYHFEELKQFALFIEKIEKCRSC